jgi:hypothetical protein
MNDRAIPVRRITLLGQFVAGLVFVAGGAYMMIEPGRHGLFARFIGLVTVAFFGAAVVSILYRLVRPAPAILITPRGIVDNASGVSVGLIPWDQIREVREYRVQGQVFLGIVPKDLDALLERQPRWKRAAIRANLSMGAAPVNVPQAALGVKVSDLVREIEQRLGRQSKHDALDRE